MQTTTTFFLLLLLCFHSTVLPMRQSQPTILPNSNFAGMGINLVIGQPVPLSLRNGIAELTYDNNKIFTYENEQFITPDQTTVVNIPMIEKSTTVGIYTSTEAVQDSLLMQLSFGFESPQSFVAMFQASADVDYFYEQESKFASYTASTYQLYNVWKVSIDESYKFTSEFIDAMLNLPPTYNLQTCVEYYRFFEEFGTHFLNQIIFGGIITMTTSYSIEYYNSTTQFQISEDLLQQFTLELSNSTLSSSQQQTLQQLNSLYYSTFVIGGGYPINYTPSQMEEWASTIASNPIPLSFEALLLSDIIPDNSSYPKESITRALVDYLSGDQQCISVSPSPSPSPSPSSPFFVPIGSDGVVDSGSETWKWLTVAFVCISSCLCIICCCSTLIACYLKFKRNY